MQKTRSLIRALAWSGLCLIFPVGAVEFTGTPQLSSSARATDNVLFASDSPQTALSFDNGGLVNLVGQSEIYRTTITPSFNLKRFAVGDILDADEYGIRSDHEWQATDALTATLKADYYQDSTLSTELIDVGRQNDVAIRDTLSLRPGVVYRFDADNTINVGYAYTDIATDPTAGQVGYTFAQASFGYGYAISETIQTSLSGFVSWYDVASLQSSTKTYGLQSGVTWRWDETTTIDASFGYLLSDIDFINRFITVIADPFPRPVLVEAPQSASTSGPIAAFSIQKTFEYLRINFNFSRQLSPTMRGQQSLEDSMNLSADYQFSRKLSVGVNGQYNLRSAQSEEVGFADADLNTDQISVSGYVGYRYGEHLSLRAEYRYAHQDLMTTLATSDSNAIVISLNYAGDPFSFGVW